MQGRTSFFYLVRLVVVIVVGAASIYMARIAWQSAQAFELNHKTHAALGLWLEGKQKPTPKTWIKYKDDMLEAIEYQPLNATFINTLGRLYLYKGVSMHTHRAIRALNVLKAKKQFATAASLRPAWVYPWLNLAISNAAIGQWKAQFQHAYHMALKQGRWEENTMPVLIRIGLVSYDHLNPELQHRYKIYLATAIRIRKKHLDWLKKDPVLFHRACSMLDEEHVGKDFCLIPS